MDKISNFNIFHSKANKLNNEKHVDISKKAEEISKEKKSDTGAVQPEKIMDAMELSAKANKAQFGAGIINPRDYLSEERIKDIEASMGVFESGVEKHKTALEEEFAHISEFSSLSQADKLEMAAKSFAMEA